MNYDGEIVIGTAVDTSGAESGIDDLRKMLSDGRVFKRIGKDELGNSLVEGISVAIKENALEMTDQMEKAVSELDLQKKMNLVSEEEYYNKLEEIRDNYLEKGSEKWWQYTSQIVSYEQKAVAEQKKAIEKLADEIDEKFYDVAKSVDKSIKSSVSEYERQMKSLENKKNSLSSKLASYGGLYGTAVFDTGEERSYFEDGVWKKDNGKISLVDIGDLKGDIKILGEYKDVLEGLKNKDGLTGEFMEGFKKLGLLDGLNLAKSVLSLNDEAFESYMSNWSEKQGISDEIAQMLYKDDENEIAETLRQKLKQAFGEVDSEFMSEGGQLWASKFSDAFKTKISEMMDQVKTIISNKISDIEYSISIKKEKESSDTIVYNLYGSGETVADQLKSARARSELERLRGGY